MQRIAVIGAGAAGLCAARLLTKETLFETVVYEATDHVGGTWFYTDDIDKDAYGIPVHSSMYKNLRTNLPKQVMAFPEFKFNDELPSFLHHSYVLKYLQDFTTHFDLHKLIKFNTVVEDVQLINAEMETYPKFNVTSLNLLDKQTSSEVFDGVMVCNGHYFLPHIPSFPGRKDFRGKVLHSHQYRTPNDFAGLDVVVLGAKSSGVDISIELCRVAKSVKLSHRTPKVLSQFPNNLEQKPTVLKFGVNEVEFVDNTKTTCDAFIFCTGYEYSFPFFKSQKFVSVEDNRVTPLYKHLIHIQYPNMSFIGLCLQICPFPQFHCQISFAIQVLKGKLKLPSKEQMLAEEQEEYNSRLMEGLPNRAAHLMGPKQWDYNDDLADLSQIRRIEDNVRLLYDLCHTRRKFNLLHYREDEFALSEQGQYYRCEQKP